MRRGAPPLIDDPTQETPLPTADLPAWLAQALGALAAGDTDGWVAMYSPDAVHEFPFAPEGRPQRLEGREAIATYMAGLAAGGRLRFGPITDIRVRESGDETIVEATGHHRLVADDRPVDLGYVWFITRRDGQVTRFRDYMGEVRPAEG